MLRVLEDDQSPEPQNHAAYRYVLPLAEKLPDGDRVHVNVDIPAVANAVIARGEAIRALGEEARTLLPGHPRADFQALPELARALCYAEALSQTALPLPTPEPQLLAALAHDHAVLSAELAVLVTRGVMQPLPRAARRRAGPFGLARGVIHLVVFLRTHASVWEGHQRLSSAELKQIEQRAEQAEQVLHTRERRRARIREARAMRARIYTLFTRALKSVTRAAQYLHPNDVDRYVPNPFRVTPKKRRRKPAGQAPTSAPAAREPQAAPALGSGM